MTRIDPKPERLYKVLCAWCGKMVGTSEVDGSHGICQECKKELLAEALAERLAQS